jgi:hypothetical protein
MAAMSVPVLDHVGFGVLACAPCQRVGVMCPRTRFLASDLNTRSFGLFLVHPQSLGGRFGWFNDHPLRHFPFDP